MNQTQPLEPQPDPTEVRDELVNRTGRRERLIIAVVIILFLWAGTLTYLRFGDQQGRVAAEENAVSLADQVRTTCERGGAGMKELGEGVCAQALRISEEPSEPQSGPEGPEGRGITRTEITSDGMLRVHYTDSSTQLVGRVTGKDGDNGVSVVDGSISDGSLVLTYSNGTSQTIGAVVGAAGEDGRGVANAAILDGQLVVAYSDGSSETLGQVVGADGADGDPGQDGTDGVPGRGIDAVSCDPSTELWTISYSDGQTSTFPDCFGNDGEDGTDGADGRGIQTIECVDGEWRVTYNDGSPTENVGSCEGEQGDPGAPAPEIEEITIDGGGPPGQDLLVRFTDGSEMRGQVCPDDWGLAERNVTTGGVLDPGEQRIFVCVPLNGG